MKRILSVLIAFFILGAAESLSAPITSVSLIVGQTLHVTVTDQISNTLPPACITWSPLGTPSIASGAADATGFNFTGTMAGTITATATYVASASCNGAPSNVSATILFTVTNAPITNLKFTSP